MNPASKTAVAAMHQVGRRLSSSYANNSRNGMGRVVDLIGSVRSNHSEEKLQILTTTGSPSAQSPHQIIKMATTQKRAKSSMAIEYDEPQGSAAPANATYDQSIREPFPSIILGPDKSVEPQGSFAEAQAEVRKSCLLYVQNMKTNTRPEKLSPINQERLLISFFSMGGPEIWEFFTTPNSHCAWN